MRRKNVSKKNVRDLRRSLRRKWRCAGKLKWREKENSALKL